MHAKRLATAALVIVASGVRAGDSPARRAHFFDENAPAHAVARVSDPRASIRPEVFNAPRGAAEDQTTHASGYVNVMEYGAIGDGLADDTPSVQAAYSAVKDSGGTIFFPPGTYRFNLVIIDSHISILGAGVGAETGKRGTIFRPRDTSRAVIQIGNGLAAVSAISISRALILGDAGKGQSDGISIHGAAYVTVTETTVSSFGRDNVVITSSETQPSQFLFFSRFQTKWARGACLRAVYGRSWTTALYLSDFSVAGNPDDSSWALVLDGVQVAAVNGYFDVYGEHALYLDRTSPSYPTPLVKASTVNVDVSTVIAWQGTKNYSAGTYVRHGGAQWRALRGDNTGHEPDAGDGWWKAQGAVALTLSGVLAQSYIEAYVQGVRFSSGATAQWIATGNVVALGPTGSQVGAEARLLSPHVVRKLSMSRNGVVGASDREESFGRLSIEDPSNGVPYWRPQTEYRRNDYVAMKGQGGARRCYRALLSGRSGAAGPTGAGEDIEDGTVRWAYDAAYTASRAYWDLNTEDGRYSAATRVAGTVEFPLQFNGASGDGASLWVDAATRQLRYGSSGPWPAADQDGAPLARWMEPPATATSPCEKGDVSADGSFLYFCTGPNNWRRAAAQGW